MKYINKFKAWWNKTFKPKKKPDLVVLPPLPVEDAPVTLPTPLPAPTPEPEAAPASLRYGITLANPWGENLKATIAMLKTLKKRPVVRVVLDRGPKMSEYLGIVKQLAPLADVIVEILDSFEMSKITVTAYAQRTRDALILGPYVTYFETANEINGDWLGPDAAVKMIQATDIVKAAGYKVMVTPYRFGTNGPKQNEMRTWFNANIPPETSSKVDLVGISWYGDDNEGPEPNWQSDIDWAGKFFANAMLAIGEVGTLHKAKKLTMFNFYYKEIAAKVKHPRWRGLFLWWYGDWQENNGPGDMNKGGVLEQPFKELLK